MATPDLTSPVTPQPPGWARRLPRDEWIFLWLVTASVAFMTAFVIGWLYLGGQNVPTDARSISPSAFSSEVSAFVKRYGAADGRVYVPPGTDAYLLGSRYSWYPELALESGRRYRIWVSSADALHGFSLVGGDENINLEVVPHHAMGVRLSIGRPGRYLIVCNEYCGLGHATMKGFIDVLTPAAMQAHLKAKAAGSSGASAAGAAAPVAGALQLRVVGNTLAFDKKTLTAHAGRVTITLSNPSPLPHDIAIKGKGVDVKGPIVSGGGRSTVSAVLKPGSYLFYCSVPGHEEAGMRGTLTVTR